MTKQKTRRDQMTEEIYREIKVTAFAIMREKGTNGLSVREIARRIAMSPSAFYHYFPSLYDLITVLIIGISRSHRCSKAAGCGRESDLPRTTSLDGTCL